MHRADPFPHEFRVDHTAIGGHSGCNPNLGKETGFEKPLGIVDVHPNGSDPPHGIKFRINEGDPTMERLTGDGIHGELHVLSVANPWQVALVCLDHQPDGTEIGHPQNRVPGFHVVPFIDHLLDHDAVLG